MLSEKKLKIDLQARNSNTLTKWNVIHFDMCADAVHRVQGNIPLSVFTWQDKINAKKKKMLNVYCHFLGL